MRWIVLTLMLVPSLALADWVRLTQDADITAALANRTIVYDAYTSQSFSPSGATLYVTERAAPGRWAARGGQYCSLWPPSDMWTCYNLEINDARVRFTGPDRSVSEGVFAE